ncbi:MAG: ABC-2 transporter permease [Oscillospiraceae bacterium]|nr:ABC-2 transporter permease [Oscillospiraceae bacterium]
MAKLNAFIGLDFATVNPQLGLKTTLPLSLSMLCMVTMSGNMASSLGIGLMVATLLSGVPFIVADKNNLDSLYATLSLDRKTVVRGRYLFTLAMNICAVAMAFVLGTIGRITVILAGGSFVDDGIVWFFAVMGGMCILFQAIQLPFYFKFNYQKAKFFSLIPLAGVLGLAGVVMAKGDGDSLNGLMTLSAQVEENRAFLLSIFAAGLSALIFVSYKLSLAFYKKREF